VHQPHSALYIILLVDFVHPLSGSVDPSYRTRARWEMQRARGRVQSRTQNRRNRNHQCQHSTPSHQLHNPRSSFWKQSKQQQQRLKPKRRQKRRPRKRLEKRYRTRADEVEAQPEAEMRGWQTLELLGGNSGCWHWYGDRREQRGRQQQVEPASARRTPLGDRPFVDNLDFAALGSAFASNASPSAEYMRPEALKIFPAALNGGERIRE